jgi:hypothetical protein
MGTKQLSVGVATGALVLLGAGTASAGGTTSNYCTADKYRNDVYASYVSYNSYLWSLTSTRYRISPADSSSDRNDVSDWLFGGSSTAALRSTGSAPRDGAWHTFWTVGSVHYYALKARGAYVGQQVIFDRFGPDPSCTTRAYLP